MIGRWLIGLGAQPVRLWHGFGARLNHLSCFLSFHRLGDDAAVDAIVSEVVVGEIGLSEVERVRLPRAR